MNPSQWKQQKQVVLLPSKELFLQKTDVFLKSKLSFQGNACLNPEDPFTYFTKTGLFWFQYRNKSKTKKQIAGNKATFFFQVKTICQLNFDSSDWQKIEVYTAFLLIFTTFVPTNKSHDVSRTIAKRENIPMFFLLSSGTILNRFSQVYFLNFDSSKRLAGFLFNFLWVLWIFWPIKFNQGCLLLFLGRRIISMQMRQLHNPALGCLQPILLSPEQLFLPLPVVRFWLEWKNKRKIRKLNISNSRFVK